MMQKYEESLNLILNNDIFNIKVKIKINTDFYTSITYIINKNYLE